eukprot:gene14604-22332_t
MARLGFGLKVSKPIDFDAWAKQLSAEVSDEAAEPGDDASDEADDEADEEGDEYYRDGDQAAYVQQWAARYRMPSLEEETRSDRSEVKRTGEKAVSLKQHLRKLRKLLKYQRENELMNQTVFENIDRILAAEDVEAQAMDTRFFMSQNDDLMDPNNKTEEDGPLTQSSAKRTKLDLPRPEDNQGALPEFDSDDDWREQASEDDRDALAMPINDLIYLIKSMRMQLTLDATLTKPLPGGPDIGAPVRKEVIALRNKVCQLVGVNQMTEDALLATHRLAHRVAWLMSKKLDFLRSVEEEHKGVVDSLKDRLNLARQTLQEEMDRARHLQAELGGITDAHVAELDAVEAKHAAAAAELKAALNSEKAARKELEQELDFLSQQAASTLRAPSFDSKPEVPRRKSIRDDLSAIISARDAALRQVDELKAERTIFELTVAMSNKKQVAAAQENSDLTAQLARAAAAAAAAGSEKPEYRDAGLQTDVSARDLVGVERERDAARAECQSLRLNKGSAGGCRPEQLEAFEEKMMMWEDYTSGSALAADELPTRAAIEVVCAEVDEEVGPANPWLVQPPQSPSSAGFASAVSFKLQHVVAEALNSGWAAVLELAANLNDTASGVGHAGTASPRKDPSMRSFTSQPDSGDDEPRRLLGFPSWVEYRKSVMDETTNTAVKMRVAQNAVFAKLQPLLAELDTQPAEAPERPGAPRLVGGLRSVGCNTAATSARAAAETQTAESGPRAAASATAAFTAAVKPFSERAADAPFTGDAGNVVRDLLADLQALHGELAAALNMGAAAGCPQERSFASIQDAAFALKVVGACRKTVSTAMSQARAAEGAAQRLNDAAARLKGVSSRLGHRDSFNTRQQKAVARKEEKQLAIREQLQAETEVRFGVHLDTNPPVGRDRSLMSISLDPGTTDINDLRRLLMDKSYGNFSPKAAPRNDGFNSEPAPATSMFTTLLSKASRIDEVIGSLGGGPAR